MKVEVAGVEILIDECDLDLIRDHNWYCNKGYLFGTGGKYHRKYIHCILAERAGLDCSNEIDHEDCDSLNNQRYNLRPATRSQNMANSKLRSTNKSGFKGVTKHNKKWRSQIRVNYKLKHLGYFDDKEDAARAYDKAAIQHFGEFANLNFPKE